MFATENWNVFPFSGRFSTLFNGKIALCLCVFFFLNIILFSRARLCDFLAFKRSGLNFFVSRIDSNRWQKILKLLDILKMRSFCDFSLPLMACQSKDTKLFILKIFFYLLFLLWNVYCTLFNNTCLLIKNNNLSIFLYSNIYFETYFFIVIHKYNTKVLNF